MGVIEQMHTESPNLEAKIENIRKAASETISNDYAQERENVAGVKTKILAAVDEIQDIMSGESKPKGSSKKIVEALKEGMKKRIAKAISIEENSLKRLRAKVTENERDFTCESKTLAKERPHVFSKILQDNHSNIQEAFKKLKESDKKALIKHFNEVSEDFGDYLFGVDGIQKAEFQMFMTDYAEEELKTLFSAVAEAQVLEINGEYSK